MKRAYSLKPRAFGAMEEIKKDPIGERLTAHVQLVGFFLALNLEQWGCFILHPLQIDH